MTDNFMHCVCGPIAAGQSTRARSLADEARGVRFAVDEWMHALYGPDRPERLEMSWVAPRELRLARLARRNLECGETFSFEVTPAMFELMASRYEPPGEGEFEDAVSLTGTSGA